MLLTLLYHRILLHKNGNTFSLMEKHLSFLASHYSIVVPGDPLSSQTPLSPRSSQICLTFDDATFDFYHYIFPLLKKLQIKAVLSVPVGEILKAPLSSPSLTPLSLPNSMLPENRLTSFDQNRFCSWKELKEMAESNLVHIASHSYSHKSLLSKDIDLHLEIIKSKEILEEKLNIPITTFVYPLGKFSSSIHNLVKKHYPYVMRIGSSINFSWQNANGMIYRIVCDAMKDEKAPLHWKNFPSYFWFFALNTLRCR
jgi:peptidoglycan/xylan/chitin deacetylase (PgdA/CDA1 family)